MYDCFWKWGKPTLGDLLALVDLGNFVFEKLVTLLTDLDDLLSLEAKSWVWMLDHISDNKIFAPTYH